jgi:hypothetical protein
MEANKFLVWTSNSSPWIGLDTRCKQQPLVQVSFKFKVARRNYIKFYQILTLETSLNFHLKPFRIWSSPYEESCSFLQNLHSHILFKFFRAQEDTFWIGQSLKESELIQNGLNCIRMGLTGLNRFKPGTVPRGPRVSRRAACSCTAAHQISNIRNKYNKTQKNIK